MGSRCYFCGESFGRCYEHPGFPEGCPPGCNFGKHDCPGNYDMETCKTVNSMYGHTCGRDAGHEGPHIEFRDNSTVAWPA